MKIITISREFGSGGREFGKRLADVFGCDYYDAEIISAIAKNSGLDAGYIEDALNNHGWQDFPISFHGTLSSAAYMQSGKVRLLVEQKRVIEEIAALGKDCVIVGRNADVILEHYRPFNVFVCADVETKLKRCKERATKEETLSDKELIKEMKRIDKARSKTREFLSGAAWGERTSYHLTVNTSGWEIKALTSVVAAFAEKWFENQK